MTGYGKTTSAQRLLLEAYRELNVPFLVIEPVKSEYRALAGHPDLKGSLRVYGIGPGAPPPLRLNPFVPVPGIALARHIDLLKAVFNASFPMFAGMSYVLEDAIHDVYAERGWDLHSGVRLRSLMVGSRGMALDSRRSVPLAELFDRPCVVELRNLGEDEEKTFVMALLLGLLYENAEVRGAQTDGLAHLTLIEEAHRLLRAGHGPVGAESADSQAKAVGIPPTRAAATPSGQELGHVPRLVAGVRLRRSYCALVEVGLMSSRPFPLSARVMIIDRRRESTYPTPGYRV